MGRKFLLILWVLVFQFSHAEDENKVDPWLSTLEELQQLVFRLQELDYRVFSKKERGWTDSQIDLVMEPLPLPNPLESSPLLEASLLSFKRKLETFLSTSPSELQYWNALVQKQSLQFYFEALSAWIRLEFSRGNKDFDSLNEKFALRLLKTQLSHLPLQIGHDGFAASEEAFVLVAKFTSQTEAQIQFSEAYLAGLHLAMKVRNPTTDRLLEVTRHLLARELAFSRNEVETLLGRPLQTGHFLFESQQQQQREKDYRFRLFLTSKKIIPRLPSWKTPSFLQKITEILKIQPSEDDRPDLSKALLAELEVIGVPLLRSDSQEETLQEALVRALAHQTLEELTLLASKNESHESQESHDLSQRQTLLAAMEEQREIYSQENAVLLKDLVQEWIQLASAQKSSLEAPFVFQDRLDQLYEIAQNLKSQKKQSSEVQPYFLIQLFLEDHPVYDQDPVTHTLLSQIAQAESFAEAKELYSDTVRTEFSVSELESALSLRKEIQRRKENPVDPALPPRWILHHFNTMEKIILIGEKLRFFDATLPEAPLAQDYFSLAKQVTRYQTLEQNYLREILLSRNSILNQTVGPEGPLFLDKLLQAPHAQTRALRKGFKIVLEQMATHLQKAESQLQNATRIEDFRVLLQWGSFPLLLRQHFPDLAAALEDWHRSQRKPSLLAQLRETYVDGLFRYGLGSILLFSFSRYLMKKIHAPPAFLRRITQITQRSSFIRGMVQGRWIGQPIQKAFRNTYLTVELLHRHALKQAFESLSNALVVFAVIDTVNQTLELKNAGQLKNQLQQFGTMTAFRPGWISQSLQNRFFEDYRSAYWSFIGIVSLDCLIWYLPATSDAWARIKGMMTRMR